MTRTPFQKALLLRLGLLGLLGWFAPALSAQLDMPGRVPRRPESPGDILIPPAPRRGDLAPGSNLELDLPGGGARPSEGIVDPASGNAAYLVFEELARARSLSAVPAAMRRLAGLGATVLEEARARLESERGPELLVAARTCLSLGTSADRAAVAERLTRAVPSAVAATLFAELLAKDPVVVSPAYLVTLLGHDNAALRSQAHQALEQRLGPSLLPDLAAALENPRTATRLLALDLAGRCEDPSARHLLSSRLGDPSAEVADRAAAWLAIDADATDLLFERALGGSAGEAGRGQAYALLALVRREEATGRALLTAEHVPTLLIGLKSSIAVVAAANAVALAHVGFRSPSNEATAWLDREVPHWLVRYGTGAVFHSDFSTLEGPALRALALLTGQRFTSGEEARRWWADNAAGFRARRGVIEARAGSELSLRIEFDSGQGRWGLLGPEAGGSSAARELYLDASQSLRLLKRLDNLGVLGLERAPTGPALGGQRFLEVSLGADGKSFAYPAASEPEWFARALVELESVVQAGRWQLFHDAGTSQKAAWLERREGFSEDLPPRDRERAFKNTLLELARGARRPDRVRLVAELERLYAHAGVPEGRDLVPWLTLIEDEPSFDPGTARLLELARIAAAAATRDEPSPPGTPSPARRVLERTLERFGTEADQAAAALARDLQPEERRALVQDPRAAARAAAGRALSSSLVPEERALALALLEDSAPAVVGSVLAALAERPLPEGRAAFERLAREGTPEIRALALRALGRLGGPGVYDLALLGLAEPQPELQEASVEALADLGDERCASLFSSLMARGRTSPLHGPARRGLRRLGAAGVEECLRLAGTTSARSRREAVLFLAESLQPEAARALMTLYTEDPADERLAWELAVLTAIDLRAERDPPRAWWEWWDGVVHDDAWAWFRAATERAGLPAPAAEAFAGGGTREGARYLLSLLGLPDPCLAERAARELERLLGREFPRAQESAGGAWRAELEAAVEAHVSR